MSRSKSLSHYPARYAEIVSECAVENKEVRVECADIHQANKLRGHWYSFIGAVKYQERMAKLLLDKALGEPMPTRGQSEILELAANAQRVLLTIEAPATVLFQNRDHSWQAQLMAKATVTQAPDTLTKAVEGIGSRLLAAQAATDKEPKDGNS